MSDAREILKTIINNFSTEGFKRFFREKSRQFVAKTEDYSRYNDDDFKNGTKIGEINFSDGDKLNICIFEVKKALSEQAGKKAQYEKAKTILKKPENMKFSAGIFIFYDSNDNFRFSLIYPESFGTHRQWNNFRRFTYFVSKDFTNKTFLSQIGDKDFSKLDDIKSAFSITAVTNIFYTEFFDIFEKIVKETKKINDIKQDDQVRDFVLLFSIRVIFLGFIQKKKWLGNNEKFIQDFFNDYKNTNHNENEFYSKWLSLLFFEALNRQFSPKNYLSKQTNSDLQLAPYLNGGLFKKKQGYDTNGWIIPDKEIDEFFDFLFSHSFTIEENSLDDEDLQLNPEFLGIIFERLVNKADGAVYTPRTEVDLMCRLSLIKWLEKNLENKIKVDNLYELFFTESEKDEDQKQGSFSQKEAQEILSKLEGLSICDPAVGSGAFLVGMIQVLDEVEQILKTKYDLKTKNIFERKKEIIKNSLYGVEVKEWAVWICQLRLWLSLFVDAPDNLKNSLDPILPSLDFKVRQGDSLVQRIGTKLFPVFGHNIGFSKSVKGKITKLKNLKLEYFDNKTTTQDIILKQNEISIFKEILTDEINEKKEKLNNLKTNKHVTQPSLLVAEQEIEQPELSFDKEEIEKLKTEITKLSEQKQALHSGNKPLVWSIEFAEIFAEKNGFDIIIGNPPYVMYKDIEDPTKNIKNSSIYKTYLKEMVMLDFPNYFKSKTEIDGFSDLYTYFYIRGLRLLNKSGIHCFVCSNFWLDVDYGVWLKKFLIDNTKIEYIIDNQARRSFNTAQINTIITIISQTKIVDDEGLVKFIAFKKSFEETVFTDKLLTIEKCEKITCSDFLRIYPISNQKLKEAGMEGNNEPQKTIYKQYTGDKWGAKYLKCPDFLIRILANKSEKFTLLGNSNIASIYTGLKDAGYSKYLIPRNICIKNTMPEIIRKPANFKLISINNGDFSINKKTKYNVATEFAPLLWLAMRGDRHICFLNKNNIPYTGNFFGIKPNNNKQILPFLSILNSTFCHLITEVFGRQGFGGGAIILVKSDLDNLPIININKIAKHQLTKLEKLSHKLLNIEIKSIFIECGIDPKLDIPIEEQEPKPLKDRAKLDKIVFDALKLSKTERKEVYRAVCRLVWNRISKAKSV